MVILHNSTPTSVVNIAQLAPLTPAILLIFKSVARTGIASFVKLDNQGAFDYNNRNQFRAQRGRNYPAVGVQPLPLCKRQLSLVMATKGGSDP